MTETERRFAQAYMTLKANGNIDIVTFAARCGACPSVVSETINGKRNRHVRAEWLAVLVTGYGIHADWLLTGRGAMMG